jgi:hypothetical protein
MSTIPPFLLLKVRLPQPVSDQTSRPKNGRRSSTTTPGRGGKGSNSGDHARGHRSCHHDPGSWWNSGDEGKSGVRAFSTGSRGRGPGGTPASSATCKPSMSTKSRSIFRVIIFRVVIFLVIIFRVIIFRVMIFLVLISG